VCIFSGQSAFEGLTPKNQQDFLGSRGALDWKGLQDVPGPTSQGLALRSDQGTGGFTQSALKPLRRAAAQPVLTPGCPWGESVVLWIQSEPLWFHLAPLLLSCQQAPV